MSKNEQEQAQTNGGRPVKIVDSIYNFGYHTSSVHTNPRSRLAHPSSRLDSGFDSSHNTHSAQQDLGTRGLGIQVLLVRSDFSRHDLPRSRIALNNSSGAASALSFLGLSWRDS